MQVASLEESAAQARLEPQALNGTNDLRLSVHGNAAEGRRCSPPCSTTWARGASGAAVQNLDLMLARH